MARSNYYHPSRQAELEKGSVEFYKEESKRLRREKAITVSQSDSGWTEEDSFFEDLMDSIIENAPK